MRRNVCVKICICISTMFLYLLWYNGYRLSLTDIYEKIQPVVLNLKQKMNITTKPKPQKIKYTMQWTERESVPFVKQNNKTTTTPKPPKLKYILRWTEQESIPSVYMLEGQKRFIENKCKHTNCYVTSNRNYLEDYTKFDVIVFSGPEVVEMYHSSLPYERSDKQKYVFATIESSQYYPLCSNRFNGYFNWTWTFRLDSETRWGYIVVRDKQNRIIGPNKVMHWLAFEDMKPVTKKFKRSLRTKTKTAAWFVSNCFSRSERENVVANLEKELAKYDLTVDMYGLCGLKQCPKDDPKCENMIKTTYYFYLAFENSFSEDYVTEKLLHGLNNNAIPVVYGGANYTRFMPEGIYLNARELSVQVLARKMDELIRNPNKYAEYFKWKNHYTYHKKNENSETDDYCGMCALLNNEEMMNNKSVYRNFRKWWNSPDNC